MYPHFKVTNVPAKVEQARRSGYRIIQEPRNYIWGVEDFVEDLTDIFWL